MVSIPIVLAFTPNYFIPAAVCMLSVMKNSPSTEKFNFICLLSEPLSKSSRQHLENILGERAELEFIDMAGRLSDIYVVEKYTIAASYRLLLPELLPTEDKVLYVDCDMVIQQDVAKLFTDIHLEGYYMAGVMEATLAEQIPHLVAIDCVPGKYVNSGFLLMNLKALRKDDIVKRFLKASENDQLEFPDQDVINIICKGSLLALKPIWNSIRTFIIPRYKGTFLDYYSVSEYEEIQKAGNIHYTGPKPWDTYTVKFELWWSYYRLIPKNIRRQYPLNKKLFLLYSIYNTYPGRFIIDSSQKLYRQLKRHGR